MKKMQITNSQLLKNIFKLNGQRQSITLSNSPTTKKIKNLKNSVPGNNDIQQIFIPYNSARDINNKFSSTINNDLRTKKLKIIKDNINIYESLTYEKIKVKKLFRDLISWDNKNNVTENYNKKSGFDLKKFKIPRIKSNKIINPELIPLIKKKESAKKEHVDQLKLIKLKLSVFDKDFDKNKFLEEENKLKEILNNEDIEQSAKMIESAIDKRLQKTKLQNEVKIRDSLIIIHKKITLNKLKKKKFIELLNETYQLLEKARVEFHLSVDILNERINYIKKFYAVFINLFKGTSIKLLEEKLKLKKIKSFGSIKKEIGKDSEEIDEIFDDIEKQVNIKSERNYSPKYLKIKNKMKYEEKIKMYLEYNSIHDDIVKEIENYEKKFNNIQNELDNIISNIKRRIEIINEDSNKLKMIQRKISQNQGNYYLEKLKKGLDIRSEGLSWIVIRLIELNIPLDSSLFPDFLDHDQIQYIIQISKYGYEINQLKIILDTLREKETGNANTNLRIFSSLTEEGKLSSIIFNKDEDKKADYLSPGNNLKTDRILLKLMQSNPLNSQENNIFSNEQKKLKLENNIIDLKSKQLKRRVSLYAFDKKFNLNNKKKRINNNNINKIILLSSDKKSKYFYDILKVIEKINNLNNLISEIREKELINFNEKFKFKDLNDDATKAYYNKIFCALFGNAAFSI